MIGAASALVKDVPPMMIAAGNHATVAGINKVGLERNGFNVEEIDDAFRAFKVIFMEGHTFDHLPDHLRARVKSQKVLDLIIPFIEGKSERGWLAVKKRLWAKS
jgi:UDP-N-acetylglucosamine acyltransferase